MARLRSISIQQRQLINVGLVVIGICLITFVALSQFEKNLIETKYEHTKQITEVAYSVVAHYNQQAEQGNLSDDEAQKSALQAVEALRYAKTNHFWVQDSIPSMLMHPMQKGLIGKSLRDVTDANGQPFYINMAKQVSEHGEGYVNYVRRLKSTSDTSEFVSFVKLYEPWQWTIGAETSLDDVNDIMSVIQAQVYIAVLVIILIVAGASYLIGKSVAKPIMLSADRMKDVAQGEGDLTQTLDQTGHDEVSRLARHFNAFQEKMRLSLVEVSSTATVVLEQADMISEASEKSQHSSHAQNDAATNVAAAMEQMTTNIQEVTNSAEAAEQATSEAKQTTGSSRHLVDLTIEEIEVLTKNISSVSDVINNLAVESENIGSVLDVIRSIAEQTNLLALNAAIEAARAGDQGRGFAVVADEVRTLASRTGQSTEEIQSMIEKLQLGAKKAVKAVQDSQEISLKTTEQAGNAGESLQQVEQLMESISALNSQIAGATGQQSNAAQEVNERISDLANMATESLAVVEALAQSSAGLKTSSKDLANVVRRFKLS